MTFYIFRRNKKSGHKKQTQEVETIEEAREICQNNNRLNNGYFLEFTEDIEYTKNGGSE